MAGLAGYVEDGALSLDGIARGCVGPDVLSEHLGGLKQ